MAKLIKNDNFYNKKRYTIKDVQYLIDAKEEESHRLEFKAASSLNYTDKAKKEIGKDVSAFANSEGGLIFYGLSEIKNHSSNVVYATALDPINGKLKTVEQLENVISSNTSPPVKVKIYPIRINTNSSDSVYVVQIPQSDTLHMCKDNRYYGRRNFQSTPLEEYEVRNLYNRISKSKLEIIKIEYQGPALVPRSFINRPVSVDLTIMVQNIGSAIERDFKLKLYLPNELLELRSPSNSIVISALDRYDYSEYNGYRIFDIPNTSPLFQNEIVTIFDDEFELSVSNWESIDKPIIAKLLYGNGVHEVKIKFDPENQTLAMES